MADLRLDIVGEDKASGALRQAEQSVRELGDSSKKMGDDSATATAKATVGYTALLNAATSLTSAIIAFGKESVVAFAEADRIGRQLQRTAGDMTGAFEAQATALSNLYAVDDEMVKQQTTLLLQWGLAPGKVGDATAAILDYAAAMGKDPLDATREFIRANENGGEKLKALGIHFTQTGDKAKDAATLIELFSSKFAGAGAARADSMEGTLQRAETALGNMKEAFGGVIATFAEKTGVVDSMRFAFEALTRAMEGPGEQEKRGQMVDRIFSYQKQLAAMGDQSKDTGFAGKTYRGMKEALDAEIAAVAAMDEKAKAVQRQIATTPTTGTTGDGKDKPKGTGKGGLPSTVTALELELKSENETREAAWLAVEKAQREHDAKSEEIRKRETAATQKFAQEELDDVTKATKDAAKARADAAEKTAKEAEKAATDMAKRAAAAAKAESDQMQQAGEALGLAFVGGLSTQLAKLAGGGEFDIAEFLIGLLPVAGAIAGSFIPGVGTALGGGIGAGLGSIASAAYKGSKSNRMHDGGWVGAPRYHDGSWIGAGLGGFAGYAMGGGNLVTAGLGAGLGAVLSADEHRAILQSGERVLSRREVSNAGGSGAVDAMARGGGGTVVNIQTFDGSTMRETFERGGGRALREAVRTGRGAPALLFGGAR